MKDFLILAHRGAMHYELENSYASIQLAMDMKADGIEIDVRKSRDGEVYLMHDARINRVARKRGVIARMLSATLKEVRLKNGEEIPTLSDVLTMMKGKGIVNVEVKVEGMEEEVLAILKKTKMQKDVIISSSIAKVIERVRELSPQTKTALICVRFNEANVELAHQLGCYSIHPRCPRKLLPSMVAYAHVKNMKVYMWTVNSVKELTQVYNIDVDGVISNVPDKMREAMKNLRRR